MKSAQPSPEVKSSSHHILASINEVKAEFSGPITFDGIKNLIAREMMILFGEDPSLVEDLLLYVQKTNDLRKLAEALQSLHNTVKCIQAHQDMNRLVKRESSLPLVKIFFRFFEGVQTNPEIFQIAKAFFTRHLSELECEYNWARKKVSFLCEIMSSPLTNPELAELFYQLGVNCNATWEEYGNTPLLFIVSNAFNNDAQYLLSLADKYPENKLDVNVRSTTYGTNALHVVVAKGYRDITIQKQKLGLSNLALAEILIQHGADVNSTIEKKDDIADGMTALHLAAARKDMEFCQLLIKHGADIHIKDAKGQTPLDLLFLDDNEANYLISHCTGNMSCYRNYQPEDASPEKLKIALETCFEEVNRQKHGQKRGR